MRARKAAENAVSTVSKVVDEARQATLEQGQSQVNSSYDLALIDCPAHRTYPSNHHGPNPYLPQRAHRVLAPVLVRNTTYPSRHSRSTDCRAKNGQSAKDGDFPGVDAR
jgi:hypothetical protein